jgi:hypothetical protein
MAASEAPRGGRGSEARSRKERRPPSPPIFPKTQSRSEKGRGGDTARRRPSESSKLGRARRAERPPRSPLNIKAPARPQRHHCESTISVTITQITHNPGLLSSNSITRSPSDFSRYVDRRRDLTSRWWPVGGVNTSSRFLPLTGSKVLWVSKLLKSFADVDRVQGPRGLKTPREFCRR